MGGVDRGSKVLHCGCEFGEGVEILESAADEKPEQRWYLGIEPVSRVAVAVRVVDYRWQSINDEESDQVGGLDINGPVQYLPVGESADVGVADAAREKGLLGLGKALAWRG